jgi:hypothetical protein
VLLHGIYGENLSIRRSGGGDIPDFLSAAGAYDHDLPLYPDSYTGPFFGSGAAVTQQFGQLPPLNGLMEAAFYYTACFHHQEKGTTKAGIRYNG